MFLLFKKKEKEINNTIKFSHNTLGEFLVKFVREENDYTGPMIKFVKVENDEELFITLDKGIDYNILLKDDDLKRKIIDSRELLLKNNLMTFKEDLASSEGKNIQEWFEDYRDLELDDIYFKSRESSPYDFDNILKDNANFIIYSVDVDENYNIYKFAASSHVSFLNCYLLYEVENEIIKFIQSDVQHD